MASSEIYCELLLKKRHGLPLWAPDPDENLEEHKKQGISIGDLGILTDDGGFTFLFNVHDDAVPSVNSRSRIPTSFEPLQPRPETSKRLRFHEPGKSIEENIEITTEATVGAGANIGPGVGIAANLNFIATHERAAFLHLPHGADRENTAVALGAYMDYAAKYGSSWYRFVNEELNAAAPNNSLYLVTGCDKSSSWVLAAGTPKIGRSVELSITTGPGTIASATGGLTISRRSAGGMEGRHYPQSPEDSVDDKNQCVFVRGLVIAIRTGSWFAARFLNKVRVTKIDATVASFSGVSKTIPFGSTAGQSQPSTVPSPEAPQESDPADLPDQEQNAAIDPQDTSGVIVQNYPEHPKQVLSPSSYISNHLLPDHPYINLVIVHDYNWMAMSSSNADEIFTANGPDYKRLMTYVLEKSYVQVTNVTLLLRRPHQDLATTIEAAIPELRSSLKDEDEDVRKAAALLVNEISKHAIPEPVDLLKDKELDLRSPTGSAIGGILMPHLPDLRNKYEFNFRYAAGPATRGSSKNSDHYKDSRVPVEAVKTIHGYSMQGHIQDTFNLLEHEDADIRRAALVAVTKLSGRSDLVMAIKKGIPDILSLLTDEDSDVRREAASAIAEFSKQADLIASLDDAIPALLGLLQDDFRLVCNAAFNALCEFAKQPHLVIAIESAMPFLLTYLKEERPAVRVAAVSLIHTLYKQCIISM